MKTCLVATGFLLVAFPSPALSQNTDARWDMFVETCLPDQLDLGYPAIVENVALKGWAPVLPSDHPTLEAMIAQTTDLAQSTYQLFAQEIEGRRTYLWVATLPADPLYAPPDVVAVVVCHFMDFETRRPLPIGLIESQLGAPSLNQSRDQRLNHVWFGRKPGFPFAGINSISYTFVPPPASNNSPSLELQAQWVIAR